MRSAAAADDDDDDDDDDDICVCFSSRDVECSED